MIALAIETSTAQSSIAIGTEQGVLASASLSWGRGQAEVVVPVVHQLLEWTELEPDQIGGVAVGVGPGLFTGLRVGVSTARTFAQVLGVPIVGIASLDIVAYAARYARWRIGAALDAKRGEVFYAFYRPVPGGVTRETGFAVGPPDALAAELAASREETLLVGNGALLYERELAESGTPLEFGSAAHAFPTATALLELAIPRFHREETSAPRDVVPLYVRRSDAEINWSRRARSA